MAGPDPTPGPTLDDAAAGLARALAVLIEVASRPPASAPPAAPPLTVLRLGDGRILYSVKEAARLLSLSAAGLNSLIYSGALLSVKVGSRRLIPAADLDRFIAELADNARAAIAAGRVPT